MVFAVVAPAHNFEIAESSGVGGHEVTPPAGRRVMPAIKSSGWNAIS